MSQTKRILLAAGALAIAFLGLAAFAVGTGSGVPERARFAIDLAELRSAAGPKEELPEEVRAERVAAMRAPAMVAMAGAGFSRVTFGFYVWQFAYGDGSTAVIDAVHSRAMHADNGYDLADYDDEAWARQEAAVRTASVMAVTHEHHDHLGGFSESAFFPSFGDRLKLTERQRREPKMGGIGRTIGGAANLESGPEGSVHRIGPGLVAISAPGHTPGSQLIYVRMKAERELLLIGDVVWQDFVLERAGSRPRILGLLEDSEAVGHQTRAILDLARAHPEIDIVVAHDVPAMEERFRSGAVLDRLR